MQTTNANTLNRRPGLAAYAALLVLAVFQLGLAMHQAQHTASDLGETCVACSHYNDVGPVSEAATALVAAPPAEACIPAATVNADHSFCYPIHARAPPFA